MILILQFPFSDYIIYKETPRPEEKE